MECVTVTYGMYHPQTSVFSVETLDLPKYTIVYEPLYHSGNKKKHIGVYITGRSAYYYYFLLLFRELSIVYNK